MCKDSNVSSPAPPHTYVGGRRRARRIWSRELFHSLGIHRQFRARRLKMRELGDLEDDLNKLITGGPGFENGEISYSARLEYAKLFIRDELEKIDPKLPGFLRKLKDVGATECWHKHGTFFEHLYGTYRIIKMWNVADSVARCALFHSAYSNSYVNLAIFEPNVDRQVVRDLIGDEAEELVQLFCVVPRQQLIFDMLILKYTDEELLELLDAYTDTTRTSKKSPVIPPNGLLVKNIRTGGDLMVPPKLIAIFLILTIADFVDQFYGWQDDMFDNRDGRFSFAGDQWTAIWPGDGRPGRTANLSSRLGVMANVILREIAVYEEKERREGTGVALESRPFANLSITVPPVFKNCTVIVSPEDVVEAVNLYWSVFPVGDDGKPQSPEAVKPKLIKASQKNPFLAEPYVVLTQVLLSEGNYEEAEKQVAEGLRLLMEWGVQWDKRMTWEGWICWARVLQLNAKERNWAKSAWDINGLGLVQ